MRKWLAPAGLLAVLLLPGCGDYDGSAAGPLYAAHPGYYSSPYYTPYRYYPAPGYAYAPAPRSGFSFSFGSGHRHRHGHRHHWRRHHHQWHR